MTIETYVQRARERARTERVTIDGKRDGLSTFATEVQDIEAVGLRERATTGIAAPISAVTGGTAPDQQETVRSAFETDVVPHVRDADGTLEAMRKELGDGVALALAPTTQSQFTPQHKQELLNTVESRLAELTVTDATLKRETENLKAAEQTVDNCVSWLVEADETPLSELGFDALAERHDRLDTWQADLAGVADERQSFLQATTSTGGEVGVDHHSLARSLYADFPVDYPVLATATRLLEVLDGCQGTVRNHLVRRA